ncbi:hypothetical protein DPMN_065591 [Dreissena polymorpha]|uniref:Uncharacterized protein n=1 Tax=Dreissena polymorpha TaxID=45954 RepID=A0A9D3YW93_DREPO|nr:hypothetical protein DPMN_065591 [Dreissena polymorpha]
MTFEERDYDNFLGCKNPSNGRIMKLQKYIDHDWQMTPIDFQVTRHIDYEWQMTPINFKVTRCVPAVWAGISTQFIQMRSRCMGRDPDTVYTDAFPLYGLGSRHCLYRCVPAVWARIPKLFIQMRSRCMGWDPETVYTDAFPLYGLGFMFS